MRKEEYLQKLEQLLYSIPAEDRKEALQFYRDYLEDAGENVDEVLRSLGTPEELAKSIQRDLYGENRKKHKLSASQWILLIILCICAAPVIVPVFGGLIAALIGIIIAIIAVVFGVGIAGIALVIAAIATIIVAIVKLIVSPFSALIMVGLGLVMVGLGLIGIVIAIWLVFKVLPKICTWIADICSKVFS